ncbi:GNAT family N-acetyltransferase [Aeromicrobium ginsengisoli]|uniref:GNAT family N-acetyltransferase n=1 Tax=Aeromicrobium ginsengisoli TaxID=363867 RepID=A0A5M4FFI2_9ACTN|nr:GNAT family N-acetyltransferase [Aeromicrobium ginsengisoli]KAA1398054.1 GNAT family N-acetyltransferase [Aeromicrobium ginsengisoli]
MSTIRIEAATDAPWNDVEHTLTGGGDGASCSCQWFMITRKEFDACSSDAKRQLLRRELKDADIPPALIAYVDDVAAAWARVGPRPAQPALARSRIVRASDEPIEDADVWAITCFVVRREHRGRGLAAALTTAAVDHAAEHGARVVEAYPIDTEQRKVSSNELFHGSVQLFSAAGFREIAHPTDSRVVMALDVNRRRRAP